MNHGHASQQHGSGDATQSTEGEAKGGTWDGKKQEHKRSKSGGILGGLSFLRSKDGSKKSSLKLDAEDEGQMEDTEAVQGRSSLATALRQNGQARKRKGSLRKAAMAKMRERSGSLRKDRTLVKPPVITTTMSTASLADNDTTPRRFSYENAPLNSSSDSGWLLPESKLSQSMLAPSLEAVEHPRLLASPITSPLGPYASTTDEDEALSFYRPPMSGGSNTMYSLSAQDPTVQRRRSNRSDRRTSLTIVQTSADLEDGDDWDYSETEWWGWVVLVVTWIVFVVGMGSCLGVWSWAWDVGETPYAPPELEDDESLPIVGYYPALIVCTAVMSWVWVVIAWVGMKYFRHSKMVGDD
ncbi:hypothetical protein C7974DRAFT_401987 [Boeremia exigua]|uniref:uncharacterized protein n=1 Tax=Boeremia exigua TaxID=749465 RepID=UPI001E8E67F8|nr:uncharacterized protein C7974DRAFT_401987 [Boeremia exigua]KAH6616553.1 hypothetical protein C7974DRAFT_401987 [Boeremia exigua]